MISGVESVSSNINSKKVRDERTATRQLDPTKSKNSTINKPQSLSTTIKNQENTFGVESVSSNNNITVESTGDETAFANWKTLKSRRTINENSRGPRQ